MGSRADSKCRITEADLHPDRSIRIHPINTVVVAIRNKRAPARIHRHTVWMAMTGNRESGELRIRRNQWKKAARGQSSSVQSRLWRQLAINSGRGD